MADNDLPIPMTNKTPKMRVAIERVFPGTAAAIAAKVCPLCKGPITPFRDVPSKKEYAISGMCQSCQDKIFGREE